jgi:hypothetical protein
MECSHCGRRAHIPLCNTCVESLGGMLTELVWLLRELEITAARQDRLTLGVARLVEHPSPANMGAVELLGSVGTQLRGIVDLALEPRALARWLYDHLDELTRRPDAARCYRTVQHLVGISSAGGPIHDVINRPDRRCAGDCPECGEICYGRTADTYCVCGCCGTPIDIARNRARAIAEYDLLPERALLTILDNLGEHVPRVRFYGWVKAGKLPTAGYLGRSGIVARRGGRHDPRVYSLRRVRALRQRELLAQAN